MTRHTVIPAAHLFLVKANQILLSRRFQTGYEDGNYSVPAGHVEAGETALQATIREAKEEIGIVCLPKHIHCAQVMCRNKQGDVDERVDFFFECTKWEGEIRNREPEKCDDLRWVPLNTLPKNTVGYIRFAIGTYRKSIFYSEYGFSETESASPR